MLPALMRPPCVVSFSGGRDSSAVVAVAADLARREGLPSPVPVSLRFPALPETAESEWQERVIRHLGISDWERVELHDELDLLGAVAQTTLSRHGLLWPPGCHMTTVIAAHAAGGSMLTGVDGDGILGGWPWVWLGDLLARRAAPSPRDLLSGLRATRPPWRTRIGRRAIDSLALPWLRPRAQRAQAEERLRELRHEPRRWDRHLAWQASRVFRQVAAASWETLARDTGTLLLNPLLDPRFVSALATAGGRFGIGDRTAAMRMLFGDLLPPDVLARTTKALGNRMYWSDHSREFVAQWDGAGADPALVDENALRREWAKRSPHAATASLLQSAWLASRPQRPQQAGAGKL